MWIARAIVLALNGPNVLAFHDADLRNLRRLKLSVPLIFLTKQVHELLCGTHTAIRV